MKRQDQERAQREAAIARARQGPDYSRLEGEIARNRSELQKRLEARAAFLAQDRAGHYAMAEYFQAVYGHVPPYRER